MDTIVPHLDTVVITANQNFQNHHVLRRLNCQRFTFNHKTIRHTFMRGIPWILPTSSWRLSQFQEKVFHAMMTLCYSVYKMDTNTVHLIRVMAIRHQDYKISIPSYLRPDIQVWLWIHSNICQTVLFTDFELSCHSEYNYSSVIVNTHGIMNKIRKHFTYLKLFTFLMYLLKNAIVNHWNVM